MEPAFHKRKPAAREDETCVMIRRVANGESQGSELVKAVGQAVGLLAGAVGLVYMVGGAVLALRLFIEDLPSRTIVAQLPRDLLVSVGLAQVVLPGIAIAALYAAVRTLLGATSPPKRLVDQWVEPSLRGWIELGVASAIPALAITAFGAYRVPRLQREWDLAWLLPVAMLLSMLIVLVALRLRASLAAAYRGRWNERRSILLMTLVVWLATVPACLVFAGTFTLLDAKVCTTSGSERTGLLIGETNQRIYIGESSGAKRQVISFPLTQVKETFIGGNAGLERCG
jgi:hypothetical protein